MNAPQRIQVAAQSAEAQPTPNAPAPYEPDDLALLLAESQLHDLARMRQIGMQALEEEQLFRVREWREGRHPRNDLAIARLEKAVRQIMVLEQEVCGLRAKRRLEIRERLALARKKDAQRAVKAAVLKAKPGIGASALRSCMSRAFSDYNDYDDYYRGSVAEIVAQICKDLGIAHDPAIWPEPASDAPGEGAEDGRAGAGGAAAVAPAAPVGDWRAKAVSKVEVMASGAGDRGGGCGPPSEN